MSIIQSISNKDNIENKNKFKILLIIIKLNFKYHYDLFVMIIKFNIKYYYNLSIILINQIIIIIMNYP